MSRRNTNMRKVGSSTRVYFFHRGSKETVVTAVHHMGLGTVRTGKVSKGSENQIAIDAQAAQTAHLMANRDAI